MALRGSTEQLETLFAGGGRGAAHCFELEHVLLDDAQRLRLIPVPENFMCPISAGIMQQPIFATDGSVYDKEEIERWIRRYCVHLRTNSLKVFLRVMSSKRPRGACDVT